jgi:hypothetical protein
MTDEAWQLAVLSLVLSLHPERLSPDELRREMTAAGESADAHDRAVCDLVGSGLLRRDGDSVVPTRAAVRFAALNA